MSAFYLDEDVDRAYIALFEAKRLTALTTAQARRLRAHDDVQLLTATDFGRILLTHNARDFLLLDRAWRSLAQRWQVDVSNHSSILVVPQTSKESFPQIVLEIDGLVRGQSAIRGRYVVLDLKWGWTMEP